MSNKIVKIGRMVVKSPTIFTQIHKNITIYKDIEVPAGEYPIFGNLKNNKIEGVLFAKLPGTIFNDDSIIKFPDGSIEVSRNRYQGEASTYYWEEYDFNFIQRILGDEKESLKLEDYFEIKKINGIDGYEIFLTTELPKPMLIESNVIKIR
ncbi:MAG TPA: hypothetical protein PLJ37_01050 [Chitinophagales bacterium]|nr:hypothetical protein [Chitinophagales bacterium]